MYRVILDPGHGGSDSGAVSKFGENTYRERYQNFRIAEEVAKGLEIQGVKVYMTRELMETISLDRRCWLQRVTRADCFVSVHCNSFHEPSANGTEVFYHDPRAQKLAGTVYHELIKELDLAKRGVKKDTHHLPYALKVLSVPQVKSILVEVGFISNEKDLKMFSQHERTGSAIASGIFSWLTKGGTS